MILSVVAGASIHFQNLEPRGLCFTTVFQIQPHHWVILGKEGGT